MTETEECKSCKHYNRFTDWDSLVTYPCSLAFCKYELKNNEENNNVKYRITNETDTSLSVGAILNEIEPSGNKEFIMNIFDNKTIACDYGSLEIINEYNQCNIHQFGRLDYKIIDHDIDKDSACREIIVTVLPLEPKG